VRVQYRHVFVGRAVDTILGHCQGEIERRAQQAPFDHSGAEGGADMSDRAVCVNVRCKHAAASCGCTRTHTHTHTHTTRRTAKERKETSASIN